MRYVSTPRGHWSWRHGVAALLCVCVRLLLPTPASAQTQPAYRDVVAAVLKANPDLRTARLRDDSARAESRIARAYPNPSATIAPQVPYQYIVSAPLDIGPTRTNRVRAASAGLGATLRSEEHTSELQSH
mgnify:CR=1 FL=1